MTVSNHDDPTDQTHSLLRRLLHDNDQAHLTDQDSLPSASDPSAAASPIPGPTGPAQSDPAADPALRSPIRPTVSESGSPPTPLTPGRPTPPPRPSLSPREQMQRAEEALIRLREKMSAIVAEYASGELNRAQFEAVYARYSEQRDITERLLMRDPQSQAWESVIRPGHTGYLMARYAAHVISYAIYDLKTADQVMVTGPIQLQHEQIEAILARLTYIIETRGNPGPTHKELRDDRCVLFVPGDLTTAVVIYTREPAKVQIDRVSDIHSDFERANIHALRQGDFSAGRLVFPHRALFEDLTR